MSIRIIAFVDHEIGYRLLEKIVNDQSANIYELVAVVTTSDNDRKWWPGVAALCNRAKIPMHLYEGAENDILSYKNIDWFFLLSWKYILPPSFIEYPVMGVINLHYSLLPEFRGVYPVNWAIIEGKKITGITYHLVNEEIDGGEVICQKSIPVHLSDTARTLQLRLDVIALSVFDEVIKFVVNENNNKNEVSAVHHQGSYKSRVSFEKVAEIDLDRNYRAIDLINLLRGMTFRPDDESAYIVDPDSKKRIYIRLALKDDV